MGSPNGEAQFGSMHSDINPIQFVIPGLTKPAPYLIRGNPVLFWIPAFAGMTAFGAISAAVHKEHIIPGSFFGGLG
jgi:hypothetical protein